MAQQKSDTPFALVNVVMTVLFILNWITTCVYNSTTSILLASTDDLEEVGQCLTEFQPLVPI